MDAQRDTLDNAGLDRRLSVAPMMDRTDRHCRSFLRAISGRVLLYTEMITTGAVLHGDPVRLLAYDAGEHPLALQLAGSDPKALAACASIAAGYGYDEINLNVGCPSERVRAARFGACLMAEPATVAACVAGMIEASGLPVTVKSRIGIDQQDGYQDLRAFVEIIAEAGCRTFIVHARKAWLTGLDPEQNRNVPPLRHDFVHRLKRDRPDLEIIINGGITNLDETGEHLARVDGVMIGRAAYADPYMLAEADRRIFGAADPAPSRTEILARHLPYIAERLEQGVYLAHITRHMLGLYSGIPGARAWRRHLSENACRPGAGLAVVEDAAGLAEAAARQLNAA
ncbi:MAG: tRNA dihydrouridine(20/20a) synthase DusA [Alphaproteobacteria bacterium]